MNKTILKQNILSEINRTNGRASVKIDVDDFSFEHNEHHIYPAASLIKIPILIDGFLRIERGALNSEQMIQISKDQVVGGAGVLQALCGIKNVPLKDLLTLMIIVSDNTATNLLINLLGLEQINNRIKTLGLTHTVLNRKMMDFHAIQQGKNNYTTPYDIVRCLKFIHESPSISNKSRQDMLSILNHQQFLDKLPAQMDLDVVWVGNKTGELPGIEHDCGIVKYKDTCAYLAVFIDELDNKEEGKSIIRNIGKLIYTNLTGLN